MFPTAKIATLSAVLSAALVWGFAAQGARSTIIAPESAKPFQHRIPQDATGGAPIVIAYASTGTERATPVRTSGKGDRMRVEPVTSCAGQAWPHIARDCLAAAEGSPVRQVSRDVTFEPRSGANVSVVVKGAALTVAAR